MKLPFYEIIRQENKIYGLRNQCIKHYKINICNKEQVVDLSNNTCIPNIIKSLASTCTFSNSQHIQEIEEIHPGLIFLQDFNGTIRQENKERQLTGTYLIKFSNTTIFIKGEVFRNIEAPPIKVIPATLQITPIEEKWENILTLESLKELHMNNTNEIKTLRFGTIVGEVSMTAFIVIIAITALLIRLCKFSSNLPNKATKITESNNLPATPIILTNIQPPTLIHASTMSVNDLPYF